MTLTPQQDDYYAQVQSKDTTGSDDKKPLKLKLKAVVKKPLEEEKEEILPVSVEKPKARLIEREHASSGLMRSVMKNGDTPGEKSERREKSTFPKISFAQADHKVKILENRPVMQIPDEVPKRRSDAMTPRRTDGTSTPSASSRLRDDSKPMFQRQIGYTTPTKDGTAKK